MTIIEKIINESGYKKKYIANKVGITDRTLLNWEKYQGIENTIKFIELCDFLNIKIKNILNEYNKQV